MNNNTTMTLINLTPHAINFVDSNGNITTVEPSGKVARVTTQTVVTGEFAGIPVTQTQFGVVEGLPAPVEGTAYIVSSLVAQRYPERTDVFIPNESVRDEQGRIIGCKSLGRVGSGKPNFDKETLVQLVEKYVAEEEEASYKAGYNPSCMYYSSGEAKKALFDYIDKMWSDAQ